MAPDDPTNSSETTRGVLVSEKLKDRPPGTLTYANRVFLHEPTNYSEDQWPTQRKRVRDRVKNDIPDFGYIEGLEPKERALIFDGVDSASPLYQGIREMLTFVNVGLRENTAVDFEQPLEESITIGEWLLLRERGR